MSSHGPRRLPAVTELLSGREDIADTDGAIANGSENELAQILEPIIEKRNKQPRQNPFEGITHLGGPTWKWTRQEVIDSIHRRDNSFFTFVNGKRANIAVVNG